MTPATIDRPKEFDARVMAYLPGLRKLASKYRRTAESRADLVTDTIMHVLKNWETFREDGGFYNYLTWAMRGVVSNAAQTAARRDGLRFVSSPVRYLNASTPPQQNDYAELSAVLSSMPTGRAGEVLMRRAMGDELHEIGDDFGVSAERVRQIESSARGKLRKRFKVAA